MRSVKQSFGVPNHRYTDGLIGVEIEAEGKNLPAADNWWRVEHDGSLKAAESGEYVLREPQSREDCQKALVALYEQLNAEGTVMDESVKAGVHVHLNVQDYSLIDLFTFITSYMVFEEVLVRYCGEYREGNLFCLRTSDAPYIINYLTKSIEECRFSRLNKDIIRYCSINLVSLHKYGSVEFRAMRSTPDLEAVSTWIDLLLCVKEFSKRFTSPDKVIEEFSRLGTLEFYKECFGEYSKHLDHLGDIEVMIHNGMRNAQEIAYCVQWDEVFSALEDDIFHEVTFNAYGGNMEAPDKPKKIKGRALDVGQIIVDDDLVNRRAREVLDAMEYFHHGRKKKVKWDVAGE